MMATEIVRSASSAAAARPARSAAAGTGSRQALVPVADGSDGSTSAARRRAARARTRRDRRGSPRAAHRRSRARNEHELVRSFARLVDDAADELREPPRETSHGRARDDRGRRFPSHPCRNGSGKAPTTTGWRICPFPRAVVPPEDVAVVELVVGGADVRLVAVHEVEPVVLPGDVALDPVDRLDEAAAVARLDVGLAAQRLERGDPGRNRRRAGRLRRRGRA